MAEARGTYFIGAEESAEMARLLVQERLLTAGMGGLLAERQQDVTGFHTVIDLACGPGGWAMDLAREHRDIEVYGVDISQRMIAYAQQAANASGLSNCHFLVMDVTQPLAFPDASFDLINIRYLSGFLLARQWAEVFEEWRRVLRPGGIVRITEPELCGVSTSAALEQLTAWFIAALWKAGQSFSPSPRRRGTLAVLPSRLRQAGYTFAGSMSHLIDISFGSDAHQGFAEDLQFFYKLVQPFLLSMEVATQEEIDTTYAQMLEQVQSQEFCGVYDLHTFWATKPE